MGIEPYLISSVILGVLAQRPYVNSPPLQKGGHRPKSSPRNSNFPKTPSSTKTQRVCKCGYTGYLGRRAVGELFLMTDEIKTLIKDTTNDHLIRETAKDWVYTTLSDQLKELFLNGDASMDEVIRVGIKDA